MPRSATTKPTESFNRLFGEGFYISQFQVSFLSISLFTMTYGSHVLNMFSISEGSYEYKVF